MNNKTNIEEDIKKLKEEIDRINKIKTADITGTYVPISILENILADRKKLQEHCKTLIKEKQELTSIALEDKANKYDSLVEKIKEKAEEIRNEKLNYNEDEYYLEQEIKGYAINALKELLDAEK